MSGCNLTCGNLLLSDGIEAIKQIQRGIAIGIAHTFPDSIIEVLRKGDSNGTQHMERGRRFHLTVALRCSHLTEHGRDSRVRLELSHYRTHERFQRTEVQVQVIIGRARRLIRPELRITRHSGNGLLVADTGARRHVLESVLDTDDGEHQQFRAELVSGLLISRQIKLNFSWHS